MLLHAKNMQLQQFKCKKCAKKIAHKICKNMDSVGKTMPKRMPKYAMKNAKCAELQRKSIFCIFHIYNDILTPSLVKLIKL